MAGRWWGERGFTIRSVPRKQYLSKEQRPAMRPCFFTLMILVVSLSVCGAQAATRTLARSGTWEAFGGITTRGAGVCGMSQEVNKRYFGLKLFAGDSTFTIQVGGKIWQIENGKKQSVVMVLDGNRPWRAIATGMHFSDGDAGLEFTINRDELAEFNRQFRDASQLRRH